jgi:hypothetical protein
MRCTLALVALVSGCGGAAPAPTGARLVPETVRVGSVELLVVPRATGEHLALGLWLDVGSLDPPDPTVAIVAGDLAAERGSDPSRPVHAVVFPDGTLFRVECPRSELDRCVGALGAAVATRAPSDIAVEQAVARAQERRERGTSDPVRESHALALSGALGLTVNPLGRVGGEVGAEEVGQFLSAHYGASRALLVVVGNVARSDVVGPVRTHLEDVHASAARAERRGDAGPQVLREEGAGPAVWTFARPATSEAEARGVAAAWARRGAWLDWYSVAAFPTRMGWIAMVTVRGDASVARTAAGWLDAPLEPEPPAVSEDAWSIVEREGTRWVAAPGAEAEQRLERWGLGVAGTVEEAELASVARAAERQPRLDPVELVPIEGAAGTAVAWRLGGPELEGPQDHGASAIAARVLAERCLGGASVRIGAGGVLVTREGDTPRVLAEAAFWQDCVAGSPPSAAEVERARREAIAAADLDGERRAAVADRIVPGSPGAVAPTPSRTALAHVTADDVIARWESWADNTRWAFAGEPRALESVATSRFGRTARTGDAARTSPGRLDALEELGELRVEELRERELLIAVRLDACGSAGAARAALDLWAVAMRGTGARVVWRDAGVAPALDLAWLGLSVVGSSEALARAAAAEVSTEELGRAVARGSDAEAAARALARAGALGAAVASVEGEPPSAADCRPTVRRSWLVSPPSSRR